MFRVRILISRGMTLVEVLISIAIITLLLQLAIPAVQVAREASRRTQCSNNLRQMGLACQLHISATDRFPSGGWGFCWAGDPDRGNDMKQPGGWVYNLLPYLEENSLHVLGRGQTEDTKKESIAGVCQSPLALFICPSRRLVRRYPYDNFAMWPMRNTTFLNDVAKTDYAANAGDHFSHGYEGPETLAEGDSPSYQWDDPNKPAREPSKSTGPIFLRSEIHISQILDGTTNTYLAGEKYLNPEHYKDGKDGGDDQTLYSGFDADVNRFVIDAKGSVILPRRDATGDNSRYLFGSAHPEVCNFVFCDGSVRAISYAIDGELHRAAGNRKDSEVTNSK